MKLCRRQPGLSFAVVQWTGKLFDCPRMRKTCFIAYVLFDLEYCATVWISSAESHLSLLDSVVRSAERFCEGEPKLGTFASVYFYAAQEYRHIQILLQKVPA